MVKLLSSEQGIKGSSPLPSNCVVMDLYSLIGKILHCECSDTGSIPVRDTSTKVSGGRIVEAMVVVQKVERHIVAM